MRLLTEHNLAFIARLMADLRQAILDGRLAEVADSLRRAEYRRKLVDTLIVAFRCGVRATRVTVTCQMPVRVRPPEP